MNWEMQDHCNYLKLCTRLSVNRDRNRLRTDVGLCHAGRLCENEVKITDCETKNKWHVDIRETQNGGM